MKKTIRLTERDLMKLVKRVIKEDENLSEWMFDDEARSRIGDDNEVDSFIEEVKETLMRGEKGHWDFFHHSPKMDLNSLISKVREICDKYEM